MTASGRVGKLFEEIKNGHLHEHMSKSKRQLAKDPKKHFEKMVELILYRRYQNAQSKLSGVWGIPGKRHSLVSKNLLI